jgi:Gamma-glutamyl cyclotransferase, AIG2-like
MGQSAMRIFFFGSLMDRDFLGLVLGRDISDLHLEPAVLHGFQRRRARGETFPVLVPYPGGEVAGVVIDSVSPEEVRRLCYYETPDYALHPYPVETAAARSHAHVFIATGRLDAEDVHWEFEAWVEAEKPLGLILAEDLMRHYDPCRTLIAFGQT